MKIIKGLISLILAVAVVFFLSFNFIYRVNNSTFFVEGVKQAYVNRGISKHDYSLIEKVMVENGREDLWRDIDLGRKALKDVYLFSFDMIDNTFTNEVMVVDTGIAYLGIKPKLTDYFDRDGEFYILKDERKPEEMMGMDVYLKPHRGYFVVALSTDTIEGFLGRPEAKGSKLVEMDRNSKESALGKVLTDLEGEVLFDALGIEGGVTGIELKKEKLTIYNELYGRGEFMDSLRNQPKERRYENFAGKNRVYISGSNIGDTLAVAIKNMNPRELDTLNMIFGMLGVTVEDMFNQIDGEVIVDIAENSWLIPLKDTVAIKKIFKFFGQRDRMLYGDREMTLEGNLLKVGTIEEVTDKVSIKKNYFLYGDLPMSMFDRSFGEESRGKLSGEITDKSILLELELNEEATRDIAKEALR